jgi:molybdopterin synthase catalytic subunit
VDFQLTPRPIDPSVLSSGIGDRGAGAWVTFEGRVRNLSEGRTVEALDYEAYAPLAVKEGEKIIGEALGKFDIVGARCVHRTGSLALGDIAVWVGVAAAHRAAAFEACRYIIDQVKARLPIWKKEHYAGGQAEWVNCAAGAPPEGRDAQGPHMK